MTISFKYADSLVFRIIIFALVLFSVGSSEPNYPDTRPQLHSLYSFHPSNPSFVKIEKQIQDKEIETTVINFHNNRTAETIKVAELNDPNLTLNLTQTLAPEASADNSVCYDDLGCITRFSFADPLLWPINLLPEARDKIDTHFTLSTRDQSISWPGVRISGKDPNGITSASFKATRPTKFYIHGWLSTGYEDRYKTFVERLLANGDFNVILVHWGGGAITSYNQAYVNIRLVGLEIAFLVKTLVEKFGVTPSSDVHLIGHSFGAHTCGYAGEKIPNLGRITGLDPAGWYFRGMPIFARLDPSDALFVESVHTDGEGILAVGLLEPLGHLDFYPNGGARQPGCPSSDLRSAKNVSSTNLIDDLENDPSCSHMRVLDLYSESFLSDGCQSIGYKCSDYESFQKGECTTCGSDNSQCAPFGLQANNYPIGNQVNVKLYFSTGESSPYCRYHYAVNVSLAKPRRAKPTVTGMIRLSISGQNSTASKVELQALSLEHGRDRQFLLTVSNSLGPVQRVNLGWKYLKTNSLDVTCILRFCTKRLYVNSVTISLMNSIGSNRTINTFKNCLQFSPGVTAPFFSLVFDSSCPTTFNLLSYLRPWNNWLGI